MYEFDTLYNGRLLQYNNRLRYGNVHRTQALADRMKYGHTIYRPQAPSTSSWNGGRSWDFSPEAEKKQEDGEYFEMAPISRSEEQDIAEKQAAIDAALAYEAYEEETGSKCGCGFGKLGVWIRSIWKRMIPRNGETSVVQW